MIPEGGMVISRELPFGLIEITHRCIESIADLQCSDPRGHGPNGEFCKQHAKRYEVKK